MIMLLLSIVALTVSFIAIDMAMLQQQNTRNQVVCDLASRFGATRTVSTTLTSEIQSDIDDIVVGSIAAVNGAESNYTYNTDYGTITPGTLQFVKGGVPLNTVRVSVDLELDSIGFLTDPNKKYSVVRRATAAVFAQDICLAVDRSGSMCFLDSNIDGVYPTVDEGNVLAGTRFNYCKDYWWHIWPHPKLSRWSRLLDALRAMAQALEQSPQVENLAIITYSDHVDAMEVFDHVPQWHSYTVEAACTIQDFTIDYSDAIDTLENYYYNVTPILGGTNIGAGIDEAADVLTGPGVRAHSYKTMILMTDGGNNAGEDPEVAAQRAADSGISIVCITFGVGADQAAMKEIARIGNGTHFHADNGIELMKIFKALVALPPTAYIE